MKPTISSNDLVEKVPGLRRSVTIISSAMEQSKPLLVAALLLHAFLSSFSQQRTVLLSRYDSCHARAPQGTMAPFALQAAGAPRVPLAYVIPSNRTPQPDAAAYLQQAIKTGQQWYREQMAQNGFGAKTFVFETGPTIAARA